MIAPVAPDGSARLDMASAGVPFLIRLHSECLTGDTLFSLRCDGGVQRQAAFDRIAQEGAGALPHLRQEGRGIGLTNRIGVHARQAPTCGAVDANEQPGSTADGRSCALGVDILRERGLIRAPLLTPNPGKANALRTGGVEVIDRVPVRAGANIPNAGYLQTKAAKPGHHLPTP